MWRRRDDVLDRETVDGIIRMLMALDDKVDRILRAVEGDDGAEEDDA